MWYAGSARSRSVSTRRKPILKATRSGKITCRTGHRLISWGDPLSFLVLPKTLRSWVESGAANFTVDTMQAQVLAMKAGNGLGVLPCILADTDEGLVRVKPDLCRQEEAIWLVVHEGVRDTKRIRVVGDFLETIVKQGQRALSGRDSEQLQVK